MEVRSSIVMVVGAFRIELRTKSTRERAFGRPMLPPPRESMSEKRDRRVTAQICVIGVSEKYWTIVVSQEVGKEKEGEPIRSRASTEEIDW